MPKLPLGFDMTSLGQPTAGLPSLFDVPTQEEGLAATLMQSMPKKSKQDRAYQAEVSQLDVENQLREQLAKMPSDYKKMAGPYEAALQAQLARDPGAIANMNWAPLAGLVDAWTGSKFSQSYQAPESSTDKAMALHGQLAKLKGAEADSKLKLQKEIADIGATRQKLNTEKETQRAYQQMLADDRRKRQIEIDAKGLATKMTELKVPELMNTMQSIKSRVNSMEDGVRGYGKEFMLPDFLVSPEGQGLRQDVQALTNLLLKERSGAAVTDAESRRFLIELGAGRIKSAEQLRTGLAGLERRLGANIGGLSGGFSEDARKAYRTGFPQFQPELMTGTGWTGAAQKASSPKAEEDMTEEELMAELSR
jgi:hypothetical protein